MKRKLHRNVSDSGTAIVESAILFPILFMIFFGLVILAFYLPTRSALQYATQTAANAIATERSDTWLMYDEDDMDYCWITDEDELENVYAAFFSSVINRDYSDEANKIVTTIENNAATFKLGDLEVSCFMNNYVVYKEIIVTASRKIPSPINLSFINFPDEIPITVSSTAVVRNGDEFVRDVDLAADLVGKLRDKYESVDKIFGSIEKVSDKFHGFLGI